MGKQNEWVNKNVVYPYNRVLFGHKKEWSIDPCYKMDKPWKHYAKRKKSDKKNAT